MAISSNLPMRMFRAEVREVHALTPGMVRIVFAGEDLAGFASTGVGDEYVRVFFPTEGRTEPILPEVNGKGWSFPDGVERSPMRTYTVREFRPDSCEVVIDFVCHAAGVAATWAQQAKAGDRVGINTPTGLYDADEAGLPAAARILEQTPATVFSRVFLEVRDYGYEQPIDGPGEIDLTWIYGGNGHGRSQLDEILRKIELERFGYVWVAGEGVALRAARKYLRHERGLPATAYKTIAYWTDGAERLREKLDRLDEATRRWALSAWEGNGTDEEREDEYVARMESLGL